MSKVVVKNSSIQGKGVYASQDILQDDVVLVIDDSHVVTNESQITPEQHEYDCDYLANGRVILMQVPEKYINHSCDPSTYVKTLNGIRKVLAMHDLRKGEEITYDYSINGDNDGTFECKCGAKNCRGVYHGNFFKLPLDLQKKYLPYLDSWFVESHKEEIHVLEWGR